MPLNLTALKRSDVEAQSIIQRYSCSICLAGTRPTPLGSGTVILVGDHAMIATAMHVVEDFSLEELQLLGWYEHDEHRIPLPQDGMRFIDETLDIAVLTIQRGVLIGSRIHGLPLSRIEPGFIFDSTDYLLICGCPIVDSSFDLETGVFEQSYVPLLTTALSPQEWPKKFEAHVHVRQDLFAPSTSSEAGPTRNIHVPTDPRRDFFLSYGQKEWADPHLNLFPPRDPKGLSGGGVWRIPATKLHTETEREPTLVGMSVGVEKNSWKWIRGIQIQHWLEMLWSNWPGLHSEIIAAGLVRKAPGVFEREVMV